MQTFFEWVGDKNFFDYKSIAKDMWRVKVGKARDKSNINFDLENDDAVSQKDISINQKDNTWQLGNVRFKCELRSAGGDWETPIYYFRCQLVKGFAEELSSYTQPFFVFIPGKEEGNSHLVKTKKGWTAPTDEDDSDKKPDERKCWAALKKHLNQIIRRKEER